MHRTHFLNVMNVINAGALCALVLGLTGCVAQTPNLDSHFGEAVNMVTAQQTLNPEASRNVNPVKGMDGPAAMHAYKNYEKSYAKPEQQANPFAIGVGAGTAGGH